MDARASSKKGRKYLLQQKYNEALTSYNKAISQDRSYAPAYANRGLVHLMLGNVEAAYADFSIAHGLDDQLAEPLVNRGFMHLIFSMTASPDDLVNAENDLQEALKLDHRQVSAHIISSMISIFQGKIFAARNSIAKAEKYTHERVYAYYRCGVKMFAKGDLDTTRDHFEIVWKTHDIDPRIKLYSGIVLKRVYAMTKCKLQEEVDLLPLINELTAKNISQTAEKLCLIAMAQMAVYKSDRARRTCWKMLSEFMPEFLPDYLRNDFFQLLLNPVCWGWPKRKLQDNKKLAVIQDQFIAQIDAIGDRTLKLNACLQVFCPSTLLGDVFSSARPSMYFFSGESSLTVGRMGTMAAALNGWIQPADYHYILAGTFDALEKARRMNPEMDAKLQKYYPNIYDCLRIKMKRGNIQVHDEGNKYITNIQL